MDTSIKLAHFTVDRPGASRASLSLLCVLAATPAVFAISTWSSVNQPGLQDSLRFFSWPVVVIELLVVIWAMLAGCEPIRMIQRATPLMQTILAALVVIAFATALLVAQDWATAMARTCVTLLHLFFGCSLIHLMGNEWLRLRTHVWPSVVAGTCAYVVVVGLFVATLDNPAGFDWRYFGLGVNNVRQMGFYSAVGAVAAIGLAAQTDDRTTPIHAFGWTLAASILVALSFWSGTRSSLFALLGAFGLGWAALPAFQTRRAWSALVFSIVAGAGLSLVHTPPSEMFGLARMLFSVNGDSAEAVSSGRLSMWLGTARVIVERPLFGFGESQFRLVVPQSAGIYNHPHNFILQLALQWGLVGAACFFALAMTIGRRFVAVARHTGPASAPAFLVATAVVLMALVEGAMYHPYPITMLILGITYVLTLPASASPGSAKDTVHRR